MKSYWLWKSFSVEDDYDLIMPSLLNCLLRLAQPKEKLWLWFDHSSYRIELGDMLYIVEKGSAVIMEINVFRSDDKIASKMKEIKNDRN